MPPVIPPTIDTLPPAPDRGDDSSVFVPEAAAFAGALDPFGQQIGAAATATYQNALAAAAAATDLEAAADAVASASNLFARSTSTLTMAPGSKTIHFQAPATGFAESDQIVALLRSDPTIRMFATVDTFDGSDDMTATVVSGGIVGSGGPYANWLIMHAAFLTAGATAAEMWAGVTSGATTTPAALRLAAAFQALTEASPIAWNTATQGFNAKVTLTANRTMDAPTNLQDGVTYTLNIKQGGSGAYTVSWNAIWDFGAAGLPILSTTVGKVDKVVGQYNSETGKIEAGFRKAA